MSDSTKVISEEMVKIIFTPIRESLTVTTQAINDATMQVRDLVRLFTTPPTRTDLLDKFTGSLEKHNQASEKRSRDLKDHVDDSIADHQKEMIHILDDLSASLKGLQSSIEITNTGISTLNTTIDTLSTDLTGIVDKLMNKMNLLMGIIGVTFTVAMIAWGIVAWFVQGFPTTPPTP